MNRLDHIVIAADNLEQGVDWLEDRLGVHLPPGGFHQTMGTHNHLMQLGNNSYLELIAIKPDAETPAWPRWFDLDQALLRASLKQQPRLITWVMNTDNLQGLRDSVAFDIGQPTALSRDQLSWEIALTDDGRLLADGLLPYCLQWHSSPHPSNGMADLGCKLESLGIYHNRAEWVTERLQALGADHLVNVHNIADNEAPYLSAVFNCPKGQVTIDSRMV